MSFRSRFLCVRHNLPAVEPALVRRQMVQGNEDLTTIDDLFGPPDWQRYGACRGENIETFVPSVGGNFTKAAELCRACTVCQQCLDFAMADDDVIGLWGGTTVPERRAMRAGQGSAGAVAITG
jgi:WhiB family redox-sensing transcriptional regulator